MHGDKNREIALRKNPSLTFVKGICFLDWGRILLWTYKLLKWFLDTPVVLFRRSISKAAVGSPNIKMTELSSSLKFLLYPIDCGGILPCCCFLYNIAIRNVEHGMTNTQCLPALFVFFTAKQPPSQIILFLPRLIDTISIIFQSTDYVEIF